MVLVKFHNLSSGKRLISTCSVLYTNFYNVLGLSPKATKAEIKDAYYKLSKQHHPDISPDSESSKKFKQINEAYEVLGNVKLRRLYDKGVIYNQDIMDHGAYTEELHRSRAEDKNIQHTGRTPIYDYDAWTKFHYKQTLSTNQTNKEELNNLKHIQNLDREVQHRYVYAIVLGLVMILFIGSQTGSIKKLDSIDRKIDR